MKPIAAAAAYSNCSSLMHDQERRDFRLHWQVAGDENDRAVLADAARERHRETRQQRGQHGRQNDATENREATCTERLGSIFQIALHFEQRRLNRAHDERQADQRERDDDADPGIRHLDPERREVLADPAVLGEHRSQCDAGHRRRQRKRHVDQCIDQLASRELITYERPCDHETEHAVDDRRQQRRTEAQPNAAITCAIDQYSDEVIPAHRRGFHHERRERYQYDRATGRTSKTPTSGRSQEGWRVGGSCSSGALRWQGNRLQATGDRSKSDKHFFLPVACSL